jgi:hypothetical protein
MTRIMRIWIATIVVAAACSSTPVAKAPAATPAPPSPIDAAPAPVATAGARGDACTPGESPQGTCRDGLLCIPSPGGYCASFCGATGTPCPDGTCVETGRGGTACAKTCASDADCRTGEGYVCDPVWHACDLPGLAAPKAPVCAARSTPLAKRAFGAAIQLTDDHTPGVYQFEPATTVADDGQVVAVYTTGARMGEPSEPRVLRGTADASMPHDREHAFDAWIARDARGRLHAVWLAFDGPAAPETHMMIAYATSADDGQTWSAPRAVHDPKDCPDEQPGCLDKPMIAIGKDTIYVAYATEAEGREGLRLRASTDGGATWGDSVAVMPASYGELAVDGRTLYAVGVDGSPRGGAFGAVGQTITLATSADGGATWSAPRAVSGDGESIPFFFVNPGVEVDAARHHIYVSYARGAADAAWDIVLATSSDGGATWTRTVVNDDGHCAAHMVPSIALDAKTGRVHVTWLDDRDGHGALAYAVCEPGGARCGANQRVSDAPFAAFSFVRHSGPWVGEYDGLVIDAKRRVLHAVWTQPVAGPDGPVSRIFHAEAKL